MITRAPHSLPPLLAHALRALALLLLLALPAVPPAGAQGGNPITKRLLEPGAAAPEAETTAKAPLTIEQQIARAEARLDEVRQEQDALEQTAEAAQVAAGATPGQIDERRQLLRDLFRNYTILITALRNSADVSARRSELTQEIEGWKGFDQKPPYPIDLVDQLQADILSNEAALDAVNAERARDQAQRDRWADLLKKAEPEVRRLTESLANAKDPAEQQRLEGLLDLARLRARSASVGQAAAEAGLRDLDARTELRNTQVSFLRRKLSTAVAHAEFTRKELNRHLDEIAASREQVQRDLVAALQEQERAEQRVSEARSALERAQKALEGKTATPADGVRLNRLQTRLDARRTEYGTADLKLEALKALMGGLNFEERTWKDRFALRQSRDPAALTAAIREIETSEKQLGLWEDFFITRMQLGLSEIVATRQALANWTTEDGDRSAAEAKLRSLDARLDSLRRGMAEVEVVKTLVNVWRYELTERRARVPLKERLESFFHSAVETMQNVWDFELFTLEDTIVIDGQQMKGERPITVGKVATALLILGLGVWIAGLIATAVRKVATKRFRAEENVAALIDKALYVALLVTVVLFAVSFVQIPLTAFAFVGGALAIGAGFGAQNLINNFISGIILLLERPIKLGDIVDVEGVRGRVVNIGARCSTVKRFDGIDMLIPNSSFLEKNVTNWTRSDPFLRFSVTVGVAYGSPTRRVHELLESLVKGDPKVLKYPEPRVIFEDFGDSALIFTIYFWMAVQVEADYRVLASEMRHSIDERFRKEGITIAFPQRDVHLDSLRPVQVEIVDGVPGPAAGGDPPRPGGAESARGAGKTPADASTGNEGD